MPQQDYYPVQEILDNNKTDLSKLAYCVQNHFVRVLLEILPQHNCHFLRLSKSRKQWAPFEGIPLRGFFLLKDTSIHAIERRLPILFVYGTERCHPTEEQCYRVADDIIFDVSDLYMEKSAIQHFEKLLNSKQDVARDEIGVRERITWLKIIYTLMHRLADHQANLVTGSGINISQLESTLKKTAKAHGLEPTRLSATTLSEIYKEAVSRLVPDTYSAKKG
jgi:hypothetical protein